MHSNVKCIKLMADSIEADVTIYFLTQKIKTIQRPNFM